jgi:hypothetical protein
VLDGWDYAMFQDGYLCLEIMNAMEELGVDGVL